MKLPMKARKQALEVLRAVLLSHVPKARAEAIARECADSLLVTGLLNEGQSRGLRARAVARN